MISGWYTEEIYNDSRGFSYKITRKLGDSFYVPFNRIHKIIDMSKGGCKTIILPEEKVQEPGFWRFENGKAYRRQWNETEFNLYKI